MTKSVQSCRPERLMGSQAPSVRVVPPYVDTDGADAVKILKAAKLIVDPWQAAVLDDWMGRDAEDSWSAKAGGLSVPRQNGKTLDVSGRSVAGMVMYGEWVIYTAHLQKTATETFMEIKSIFESKALAKHVREVKAALGREQIILNNGGRIMFVARTRNGGRGLHGDCLIFDEAQELTSEQLASFLPALAASKNPQTLYLGTPPDENCVGDVFRRIRGRCLAGESKTTAWTEFSVPEIGDVADHTRWAAANPALGRRIKETTIEGELEQMSPDTFARERLGWWSPVANKVDLAIQEAVWMQCASGDGKPEGKTAYGVKFSPDGSEVALCGAVIPSEGKARISLIERRGTGQGLSWLADWLNARYTKASCVVIDGRNGVDVLVERLSGTWKAKDSVIRPNTKDVIASVSLLCDSLSEQTVTWYDKQEALKDSALSATKRTIGGGWGFGGSDSSPIEACALALWGAKTSKRDPNRRMKIG